MLHQTVTATHFTGRHGRERWDDDQAVSRVEFPVEDVETAVTRVAVAEKSVDTVLGDA